MAIAAHDIVSTSPTNTFATLNPIAPDTGDDFSMSEGNLRLYTVDSFASDGRNISTIPFLPAMGKIYIEVAKTTNAFAFGFSQGNNAFGMYGNTSGNFEVFAGTNANGQLTWQYRSNNLNFPALNTSATEVIGVLVDFTNSQFKIKLASTDYTYSFSHSNYINFSNTDNILLVCTNGGNAGYGNFNFGVDPTFAGYITLSGSYGTYNDANGIGSFFYDPTAIDSSALALCTANLPDPAIDPAVDDLPEDYMRPVVISGTNADNKNVFVGFQPDLCWLKNRNGASGHMIVDSVRGAGYALQSDNASQEGTYNIAYDFKEFTSTGFNLGAVSAYGSSNPSGTNNIISWCFRAGGAPTASDDGSGVAGSAKLVNTSGTESTTTCKSFKDAAVTAGASNVICPSKMSINQKSGFSIVKYEGNSPTSTQSYTSTLPHGLSKTPEFIIIKGLSGSGTTGTGSSFNMTSGSGWLVNHVSTGLQYSRLDSDAAAASSVNIFKGVNSSYITIGVDSWLNCSDVNYIMYAFTSIEGYSAFGSYTGNGSATSGPFIFTGFKPALVICKVYNYTSTYASWAMFDNARDSHNVMNKVLYANQSAAEGKRGDGTTAATNIYIDFLSNGFKIRSTQLEHNANGDGIIFAAWAEMPQKFAVAR